MFDFNSWSMDTDMSNMFFDCGSRAGCQVNDAQYDNGTPWLAWDSFLYDVNSRLSDTGDAQGIQGSS
jgi:hypothetical protein